MAWKRRSAAAAAVISLASTANAASLTATDKDAICRVVYSEAGREPLEGQLAVAAVILTRMGEAKSAVEVVNAHRQFEPVMRAGGDYRKLPLTEKQAVACETMLELAVKGMLVDPSNGATHFQNRTIVAERARNGTVRPSLVDFGGMPKKAEIGRHTFYGGEASAARAPAKVDAGVSRPSSGSMIVAGGVLREEGSEEGETIFVIAEEKAP